MSKYLSFESVFFSDLSMFYQLNKRSTAHLLDQLKGDETHEVKCQKEAIT